MHDRQSSAKKTKKNKLKFPAPSSRFLYNVKFGHFTSTQGGIA